MSLGEQHLDCCHGDMAWPTLGTVEGCGRIIVVIVVHKSRHNVVWQKSFLTNCQNIKTNSHQRVTTFSVFREIEERLDFVVCVGGVFSFFFFFWRHSKMLFDERTPERRRSTNFQCNSASFGVVFHLPTVGGTPEQKQTNKLLCHYLEHFFFF